MSYLGRQWYLLAIGLLAMCAFVLLLEWTRPGLGDDPPNERRDATALFYTELEGVEVLHSGHRRYF